MKSISKKSSHEFDKEPDDLSYKGLRQMRIPLTIVAIALLLLLYDESLSGIVKQHKKNDEVKCQYDVVINKDDGLGRLRLNKQISLLCDGKIKVNFKTDDQIPIVDGAVIDVTQINDLE